MIYALQKKAVQGKVREDYGPGPKLTQVTSAFFKEAGNFGVQQSAQKHYSQILTELKGSLERQINLKRSILSNKQRNQKQSSHGILSAAYLAD